MSDCFTLLQLRQCHSGCKPTSFIPKSNNKSVDNVHDTFLEVKGRSSSDSVMQSLEPFIHIVIYPLLIIPWILLS